jgi:cbb3-type cytochrome oxidase maturation protein
MAIGSCRDISQAMPQWFQLTGWVMEIIFVLVPVSLLLIGVAIGVFIWAVNNDQFDDLDRQGYEILFDEDDTKEAGREGDEP